MLHLEALPCDPEKSEVMSMYRVKSDIPSAVGCLDPIDAFEDQFLHLTGLGIGWKDDEVAIIPQKSVADLVRINAGSVEGYSLYSQIIDRFGWQDLVTVDWKAEGDTLHFRKIHAVHQTDLAWAGDLPMNVTEQIWRAHAKSRLPGESFLYGNGGYEIRAIETELLRAVGILHGGSPLEPKVFFHYKGKIVAQLNECPDSIEDAMLLKIFT
jgi:hypothetical protein